MSPWFIEKFEYDHGFRIIIQNADSGKRYRLNLSSDDLAELVKTHKVEELESATPVVDSEE